MLEQANVNHLCLKDYPNKVPLLKRFQGFHVYPLFSTMIYSSSTAENTLSLLAWTLQKESWQPPHQLVLFLLLRAWWCITLSVKCMWELVVWNVPCPGHSVPSSLPVTQQESSCGQSERASHSAHTFVLWKPESSSYAKKRKKLESGSRAGDVWTKSKFISVKLLSN